MRSLWFLVLVIGAFARGNVEQHIYAPVFAQPVQESSQFSPVFALPAQEPSPQLSQLVLSEWMRCPAVDFSPGLVMTSPALMSQSADGTGTFSLTFSPKAPVAWVDAHFQSVSANDIHGEQLNVRMEPAASEAVLSSQAFFSFKPASSLERAAESFQGLSPLAPAEPIAVYEVPNIKLKEGDRLRVWFTYRATFEEPHIDCDSRTFILSSTESKLLAIGTSLAELQFQRAMAGQGEAKSKAIEPEREGSELLPDPLSDDAQEPIKEGEFVYLKALSPQEARCASLPVDASLELVSPADARPGELNLYRLTFNASGAETANIRWVDVHFLRTRSKLVNMRMNRQDSPTAVARIAEFWQKNLPVVGKALSQPDLQPDQFATMLGKEFDLIVMDDESTQLGASYTGEALSGFSPALPMLSGVQLKALKPLPKGQRLAIEGEQGVFDLTNMLAEEGERIVLFFSYTLDTADGLPASVCMSQRFSFDIPSIEEQTQTESVWEQQRLSSPMFDALNQLRTLAAEKSMAVSLASPVLDIGMFTALAAPKLQCANIQFQPSVEIIPSLTSAPQDASNYRIQFEALGEPLSVLWVDVHYSVNGGTQRNYRMERKSTGVFEHIQPGWNEGIKLNPGDTLEYSFTFKSMETCGSQDFSFSFPAPQAQAAVYQQPISFQFQQPVYQPVKSGFYSEQTLPVA